MVVVVVVVVVIVMVGVMVMVAALSSHERILWKRFNDSLPTCVFLFFLFVCLKWRSARAGTTTFAPQTRAS